jgi:hypothetical protein
MAASAVRPGPRRLPGRRHGSGQDDPGAGAAAGAASGGRQLLLPLPLREGEKSPTPPPLPMPPALACWSPRPRCSPTGPRKSTSSPQTCARGSCIRRP